ncbi:MAG: radical SAM protein [Desulfurococcales archaeon ex4484_58]|nr:MAG: radical SAM protein [Desulfurococcales archaeon ex4484_58]
MVKIIGKVWNTKPLYLVRKDGIIHTYIGFGVIDRGTNVLQVRPITLCPLNCIFCSVDAGPHSEKRIAEFIVDLETMVRSVVEIARYKGGGVEALIDSIGEALTYPHIIELIRELKREPSIQYVALETHGMLLNKKIIRELEEAGLDRINLSIETLDPEKAKFLQGVRWYNVDKVVENAEYIVRETSIDLHVTPVWIPGINDKDVVEVVEWAYRIGAGKKWPPATIQKYVVHKYGRKIENVKPLSWKGFWKWIKYFESKYGLRVHWSMSEWGMIKKKKYPCPYRRGDKVFVEIVSPGVFCGEYIGLSLKDKTLITIIGKKMSIGEKYYVEIIHDKDCLLIAKAILPLHDRTK